MSNSNYIKKQSGDALCGLYALNHLFNKEKFVKLDNGESLYINSENKKVEKNGDDIKINMTYFCTQHKNDSGEMTKCSENNEWYTDQQMIEAIKAVGHFAYDELVTTQMADKSTITDEILQKFVEKYYNNDNCIGVLINQGSATSKGIHWTCIKKKSSKCKDAQGMYINSIGPTEECIKDLTEYLKSNKTNHKAYLPVFTKNPSLSLPSSLSGNADDIYKRMSRIIVDYQSCLEGQSDKSIIKNCIVEKCKKYKDNKEFRTYLNKTHTQNEFCKSIYDIMNNITDDEKIKKINIDGLDSNNKKGINHLPDYKLALEVATGSIGAAAAVAAAASGTVAAAALQPQPQQPMPSVRPPSEFTTIQLGPRTYNLPTGKGDIEFRKELFAALAANRTTENYKAALGHLYADEIAILQDTGFIKESFLVKYADDIPTFFEALPECTTDTAVMLNKQCSKSYFLIYALLHSAAQEVVGSNAGTPMSDVELLQQQALLSSVKPGDSELRKFILNLLRIRTPGYDVRSLLPKPTAPPLSVLGKPPTKQPSTKLPAKSINRQDLIKDLFTLYLQ